MKLIDRRGKRPSCMSPDDKYYPHTFCYIKIYDPIIFHKNQPLMIISCLANGQLQSSLLLGLPWKLNKFASISVVFVHKSH